jgi:DNA invertase Pin-like site-specific DNA recombinase
VVISDWFCGWCVQKNNSNKYKVGPRSIVYLYERTSTKGQDNPLCGKVGLDTQNNLLLEFAFNNGLIINGTIRETESAYKPNINRIIGNNIKKLKKDECLIVYSVSRFSRNLEDGLHMLKIINDKEAYVYSVSENVYSYEDKFISLLKAAEDESKNLGLKIKTANSRIKLLGGHVGKAPFGFRVYRDSAGIRKLEPEPAEQSIIEYIKNKKITTELIDDLNKKHLYRGKIWTIPIVKRLYAKHYSSNKKLHVDMKSNKKSHVDMKSNKKSMTKKNKNSSITKKLSISMAKKNSYNKLIKGFVVDLRKAIDNSDSDCEMADSESD